jgi:hypothetical protein
MMFTRDLRDPVARGEVTVSIRLWSRPKVDDDTLVHRVEFHLVTSQEPA